MDVKLLGQLHQRAVALDRRDRHLCLKGRCMVPARSPAEAVSEFAGQSGPLSGRSYTYRPVQIAEAGSLCNCSVRNELGHKRAMTSKLGKLFDYGRGYKVRDSESTVTTWPCCILRRPSIIDLNTEPLF